MSIQSLLIELIAQILSLVGCAHPHEYEPDEARLWNLCGASLVCRAWRKLAQRVLWEDIQLESSKQVFSFVAGTTATGCKTAILVLWGKE